MNQTCLVAESNAEPRVENLGQMRFTRTLGEAVMVGPDRRLKSLAAEVTEG